MTLKIPHPRPAKALSFLFPALVAVEMEIDSNSSFDSINITGGNLTYGGTLSLVFAGDYTPLPNATYAFSQVQAWPPPQETFPHKTNLKYPVETDSIEIEVALPPGCFA